LIETKGGDVSAYIPTNVISITDGQIFLETDLFFSGVRPAINVGISVSRVGGNAQIPSMKQVAGRLRLDLAQYRALEAFAEFGSDLDKASQAQLDRGARVVEILKQPQFSPFPVEDQVITIWAATNGYLDDIPIESVKDFEDGLIEHMSARYDSLRESIRTSGKKLTDDQVETLKKGVSEFKEQFAQRVDTVETTASEEGVPEPKDQSDPTAAGGDDSATDTATPSDDASPEGEGTPGE
jgi:F-type H+-transporting ATPase subunit alpha